MKKRLANLAQHRHRLIAEIKYQRSEMADISAQWQRPLALADTGLKAVRFVRNHPAWMAGGVAALLALRRKGVVGLAMEGWRLLYLYPAVLTFGLKYLASASRAPHKERHTEIDH